YRHGVLPLAPLTVLIGANASGKSNIIEAIRLLSEIAKGVPLNLFGQSQAESINPFRGDIRELGYQGKNSFELSCQLWIDSPEWHIDFAQSICHWKNLEISLYLDNGELRIDQEKIISNESKVPLYQISSEPQGAGHDVIVAYNNFARGGKKPTTVCSSNLAIFTQLLSEIRFRPENEESRSKIPRITSRYVELLRNIIFLEPEPSIMREYSHQSEQILEKDGKNLSGVLYSLCQEVEIKQSILGFVKSLPEQDIQDVKFLEAANGEVLVQLKEMFGDNVNPYNARTLSDGTLRVLSIAAALLSAPEQGLVIIEEIDNGIHPSRVKDLLAKINAIAKKRQLRILTTSHNPALLDSLPNDAVPNVVFCYRNPEDGSSKLVRLRDIPDYVELMVQGSVGYLMTHGILERFVKYHPGPEEKKRRALEWLEKMRKEVENVG
ncbi:MAG: AAA family ATPase, partial [Spirulinaceae cyanobacterium]